MKRSEFLVDCATHLSRNSFVPSFDARRYVDPYKRQLGFVRPSIVPELFEEVTLIPLEHCIGVSMRMTIVPSGNRRRNMFLEVPLTAEMSVPAIKFRTKQDREIATGLIESIPHVFSFVSPDEIKVLLNRTELARKRAIRYLERVDVRPESDCDELLAELHSALTREQLLAAKSMLQFGLVNIPCNTDAEEDRAISCYKAATALIVFGSSHEDTQNFPADAKPDDNPGLAWCIQVIASRLYSPNLWFGR